MDKRALCDCVLDLQEAPAIVESQYDVRIVGCSGGIGGKDADLESDFLTETEWGNFLSLSSPISEALS